MKVASAILLAAFALTATGCDEFPPRPQSADQAMKTYQSRIAESCSDKHKENLSPDALNTVAKDFYHGLDLNAQQRVDQLTGLSCSASGASQPDCYNTGFISAVQNIGEMNHFAIFACAARPNGA